MRRIFISWLVAATSFAAVSLPDIAGADNGVPMKSMAIVKGRCNHLIVLGSDKTNACQSKMLNTEFVDGRSGFYFVASDDVVISFSGMGPGQIKLNEDIAIQPIDTIIVGVKGRTSKVRAVGKCRFENPLKGSVPISCQADTPEGIFEADFVTDGSAPDMKKF
jgi:hypothetical protein